MQKQIENGYEISYGPKVNG